MNAALQPSVATAKKRGRKPASYTTSWNETINGLARRPSDGRWRIIGTDTTFTEPDERLAVHKFQSIVAQQKGETIDVPIAAGKVRDGSLAAAIRRVTPPIQPPTDPADRLAEEWASGPRGGDTPTRLKLTADGSYEIFREATECAAWWPWLRRYILTNYKLIAKNTGIESMAYLPDLKPPEPLPTFQVLETTWKTYGKCSELQKKKVLRGWNDFIEATGIEGIDDITPEVAVSYQDDVHGRGLSGKQQQHIFSGIRRVVSFAKSRAIAVDAMQKALTYLELLRPSESAISLDPKPIDVDDWKRLLANAEGDDKAMVLLMLNCAMYLQEVIRLEWDDIRDGCVTTRRKKKGQCVRVAVLWKETLDALKDVKRKGAHIFNTYAGEPIKICGAQRRFAALTDKATLLVTASQLRDGAYTAAVQANVSTPLCQLLVGHRSGMADHYVQRNPKMVAPACEAIHRHYFSR